jgi:hypothetical protein
MTKHRYEVSGIENTETNFTSECIDNDILSAINQYRDIHHSVHSITRKEQVKATEEKRIIAIFRHKANQ